MVKESRSGKDGRMSDDNEQWWFCLKHQTVEHGDSCANSERMGPYASREEAERSLSQAAERTEQWDNDPKWRDD
jgi:hypothetical protein